MLNSFKIILSDMILRIGFTAETYGYEIKNKDKIV